MLPVYSMIFDVAGWTMALELLREVWLEGQIEQDEKGAKFKCEKEKDEDTRSQLPIQFHVFDVLNWIYSLPFTGFSLSWQQSLVFPVQSSVLFSGQQGLVTSMYTFTGAILACARFRGADGGLESWKRNMQLFVKQTFQVVKWFHI